MPTASWSDIVDTADPSEAAAPQRASFADIESIVSPPSTRAPRRATFADIAEIVPPAPAFSPLEQEVIAGSPATRSRTPPSAAQIFGLDAAAPVGNDIELPKDVVKPAMPTGRLGSAKTGGAATAIPDTFPVLDAPHAGAAQVLRGVRGLVDAASAPAPAGPITPAAPVAHAPSARVAPPPPAAQPLAPATMNAASDVIEGTFKAMEPLIVAGMLTAPIATAVALATASGGAAAAEKTVTAMGGSPETARLAANLAATVVGGLGTHEVVDRVMDRGRTVAPAAAVPEEAHAEAPIVVPSEAQPEAAAAPEDAARPGAPVPEAVAPPTDAVAPPNVAHVSDIVDVVEPGVVPNEGVKPAPPVLDPEAQAERDQTAGAPNVAHVDDVAEVLEPPVAPVHTAHVDDVAEVVAPPPAPQEPAINRSRPEAADYVARVLGAVEQNGPPGLSSERRPSSIQALGDVHDVIYRGPDGRPVTVARLIPGSDGALHVMDLATDKSRGLLSGRGVKAVGEELIRLKATDAAGSMTPDAIRLLEHSERMRPAEILAPGAAESGKVEGSHGSVEAPVAAAGPVAPDRLEERADAAGSGLPAEGRDSARDAPRRTDAEFEHDAVSGLVDQAVAGGHTGDRESLHRELADRLQLIKELDAEFADSGHNPDALLREIARLGGLSIKAESALKGELAWLKQHQDNFGTALRPRTAFGMVRGIKGVFSERAGHSLDHILEGLGQEPRFDHIRTINDLLEEIRAAATADHPGAAIARLTSGLGDRWWERVGRGHDEDISFDPEQLEAESRAAHVDTLDTGEKQPRLPGAEDARQAGKADTSFRAPTQASGDDFSLDTPLTDEQKAADARKAAGPSMFDDDGALSMPNRSKRADSSGALVPSPAARAVSLLPGSEKQMRPSEIVRDLSQSLDELPIRVGKFKQQALGIYKPKEQTIRLKVANDLDTLAHELGHHIHESLLGTELPPKTYRGELEALGLPTSRSSYSLKQKLAEGQAEFTRLYLSDPAAAEKAAPVYYKAFETALESHPELAAVLQRAQRQYTGHLSQDPVTRGLAHLDFDGLDAHPKTDLVTRLQTAWVDDLYPMRRMVEDLADHQPIDYTKNGYVLARLARGSTAKANGFLEHGVRAADGTFIAPALAPALKPVKGQIREFAGYLAALRALELRGRGMETGMTRVEAQAIVDKFKSPTFDTARDAVYAYQDGLLTYATHAGTLSVDQLKAIKALNKAYVPFQRVIDDVSASAGNGKGGIANRVIPVKRIKGSGRDIINPLESIVKNTHTLVSMVEQNRAMQALVDQAQKTVGGGRYLEAIPEKQVATSFNLDRVARDIKEELDAAGVDYPDNLDFDKLVTVFTPTQQRFGEKGVVSVLRNGERKWFQVNDQALYDAIDTLGAKSPDLLVNLFMTPARWLRAGATTSIGFIARNPIRDNFEAYVNSRYGYKPGYDFLRGVFELYHKGEDYQAFMNSGAGNAALVGLDRNRLRQELVNMGAVKRRVFADSVILNPINLLQALSEAMEHATRIGEFKRAVESEGRTAEGYARAALAARDVTIDFARGGSAAKLANKFTAFFNAGVQGNVRMAEVFRKDPVGATRRAVLAVTVPSLALWAINHDDDAYRELPDWERNTYWHMPSSLGAGHGWIRVPKPFTLGFVFGNTAEAALDYLWKKDPEGLARVLPDKQTAWREVVSVFPTALMPAVEIATNYDTFRDRSIVNAADVNLDTALQYNRWTSDLAKFVGPKIGIAPAKLDHLIYGYGAGFGAGAVQAIDKGAALTGLVKNQKPAGGAGGWPLVGTFYRETPGADARSLEQFYRLRDRVEGAVGSLRRYEKAGDEAAAAARKAQALADFAPDAGKTLERVRATDKGLTTIRDDVNQVFANPRLEPDEKKELLDRLYEQMVNGARAGLGKPALPSRFSKPPSPALLEKLKPVKPSAPAARPAAVASGASGDAAKPSGPRPAPATARPADATSAR